MYIVEVAAMRKVVLAGFVFAALLVVGSTGGDAVVAQVPKKPGAAPAPAASGVIEIGEGKDGKFRFFVRDDKDKLLAMSGPPGFATAKDAEEAIKRLKDVVKTAKVTTLKKKTKDEK